MSVLLVEKINHRFKRVTKSNQASGLSVCTKMISDSVDGVTRAEVDSLFHVEQMITYHKPSKVLFQGIWVSEGELSVLRNKYPRTRFYIHIHSNIPFLASDPYAFHRIKEAYRLGVGVVFNDRRAAEAVNGSLYLPNIYKAPKFEEQKKHQSDLHVVCAGSLRPLKNHATQALAAIQFAESKGLKLHFYCNIGRNEGGDSVKAILHGIFSLYSTHQLVSMPWMDHSEFLSFLTSMDYGMQVSMSESFNIVAADYTAASLPMVVSPEVSWASERSIASCGSAKDIFKKMMSAHECVKENQMQLHEFSQQSISLWSEFVQA